MMKFLIYIFCLNKFILHFINKKKTVFCCIPANIGSDPQIFFFPLDSLSRYSTLLPL